MIVNRREIAGFFCFFLRVANPEQEKAKTYFPHYQYFTRGVCNLFLIDELIY